MNSEKGGEVVVVVGDFQDTFTEYKMLRAWMRASGEARNHGSSTLCYSAQRSWFSPYGAQTAIHKRPKQSENIA